MAAVPKRAEERLGHRTAAELAVETITITQPVKWPGASTAWSPIARSWYKSLQTSPQSQFYVDSDVWTARLAAEMMTKMLTEVEPSRAAALLKTIYSMMSDLMSTEGARRRLSIEVAIAQVATESTEEKIFEMMQKMAGGPQ